MSIHNMIEYKPTEALKQKGIWDIKNKKSKTSYYLHVKNIYVKQEKVYSILN